MKFDLENINTKQRINSVVSLLSFSKLDTLYVIMWFKGLELIKKLDLMSIKISELKAFPMDHNEYSYFHDLKEHGKTDYAFDLNMLFEFLLARNFTEEELTYIRMLIEQINSESE